MPNPSSSNQCNMCKQPSIITRPYSGEVLCEQCFRASIESKVREAISKWQMLQRTDRIAVAFSGGKDSTVLLSALVENQRRFPESEIIAITLEEGIATASDRMHTVRTVTQILGVEHIISSYQELYSVTMDEITELISSTDYPYAPCVYCGVMRRQGLNILARQINADKLAIGHNLDDEVQSMLMNLIRGDVQRLSRLAPIHKDSPAELVPRIKPLYHILEQEIALYANSLDLPYYKCPCAYGEESLRTEIRQWLNEFEEHHPGTKFNLYATISRIIDLQQNQETPSFLECETCGEPTSRPVCAVCESLTRLGLRPRNH